MFRKIKNFYHLFLAICVNIYFKFPASKIIVIGITGTDGKTTTTNMIYHILKENGFDVSLISTVGAYINGEKLPLGFHVTNPSSFQLLKFIKKIKDKKAESKKYLVLEVSSHGIDQYRNWGIKFEVGGITNITHEHLDYHKTYENYVWTKAKLVKKSKIGFLNLDDESYSKLLKYLKGYESKIKTYSLDKKADYNLSNFSFIKNIKQKYNQENALLASCVCVSLGLKNYQIEKAFTKFMYPTGRLELVYDKGFKIFIDFAHTPNAFKNVLPEARKFINKNGKLIHVFGVAGRRDFTKRCEMGEASVKFADKIILTAEDPRDEKLAEINSEIKKMIKSELKKVTEIDNRVDAINKAIEMANKGDVVILTGKAHEKSNNLGSGEEDWDEFKVVKDALVRLKK